MVEAVKLEDKSMFRTSYGHKGTLSIYLGPTAVNEMLEAGFGLDEKGLPVVWLKVAGNGLIEMNREKQPGTVCRKFSLTPRGRCKCAVSIAAGQVALPNIGQPWESSEVDAHIERRGDNVSFKLIPPRDEHRYPPKRQNRTLRADTPRKPEGIMFLGTFPDGSPIDFALPMARVLELCTWLQKRDIEVGYEGEFHEG